MKRRAGCLVLAVLLVVLLCQGCSGQKSEDDSSKKSEYYIYCINVDGEQLEKAKYAPAATSGDEGISEFLSAIKEYPVKKDFISAIPENVTINSYSFDKSILTVDFSAAYVQMNTTKEVLCRGACVLTLTQLSGVSQVVFTVEGTPLTDSAGNSIGPMTSDTFIDNSSASVNQYTISTMNLYFADSSGSALIKKAVDVRHSNNTPIAKIIVQQLMKTPPEGCYPVIPTEAKLLGVSIREGVCYVNFDSGFLEQDYNTSDLVQIYAVVDSIIDGAGVSRVQISINGDSNLKFHESISLVKPFEWNTELISDE